MSSIVRLRLEFRDSASAAAWLDQPSSLEPLPLEAIEANDLLTDPDDPDAEESQFAIGAEGWNGMVERDAANGNVDARAPHTVREALEAPGLTLAVAQREVALDGELADLALFNEFRLVTALVQAAPSATGELLLLFLTGEEGDPVHTGLEIKGGAVHSRVIDDAEAEELLG